MSIKKGRWQEVYIYNIHVWKILNTTVSWPVEKKEGKGTITVEKGKKKPLFTDDMFMHAES